MKRTLLTLSLFAAIPAPIAEQAVDLTIPSTCGNYGTFAYEQSWIEALVIAGYPMDQCPDQGHDLKPCAVTLSADGERMVAADIAHMSMPFELLTMSKVDCNSKFDVHKSDGSQKKEDEDDDDDDDDNDDDPLGEIDTLEATLGDLSNDAIAAGQPWEGKVPSKTVGTLPTDREAKLTPATVEAGHAEITVAGAIELWKPATKQANEAEDDEAAQARLILESAQVKHDKTHATISVSRKDVFVPHSDIQVARDVHDLRPVAGA